MAPSKKEIAPPTHALSHISAGRIAPNKHNPRLIFRQDELQALADSIQDHGVQVPISVYKERGKYVLIDGERRWRACKMINVDEIPAIIYPKPDPIQNIVFMFNIHRFRKDWDPLPIALKLEELSIMMEEEEGKRPTEAELAAMTGMTRGAIRRCRLILEIPTKYIKELTRELNKPAHEQRVTTDLFIEIQRAVKTLDTYVPEASGLKVRLRDVLVRKYKRKVIPNVVHMRMVAKIARSPTKGVRRSVAIKTLRDLTERPNLSVADAYSRVAWAYDMRSVFTKTRGLMALVESLRSSGADLPARSRTALRKLSAEINKLLRGD